MPPLILIPLALFFACILLQFWAFARVRNALIDRHPEVFLEVERSSIFPQRGLHRFVWRSGYRELGDPELDRDVHNVRLVHIVAFLAWAGIIVGAVTTAYLERL